MKTILHKSRTTGYLLFLFLLTASFSWGQGHETFENVPTSPRAGSYLDRVWTGDDEIEWNATDARTDETINGKAITVRNGELWATITGGIGDLTLTTQRVFGGGSGDLTVLVDGVDKGTIAYSGTLSTGSLIGINVEGTVTLRLQTPGNGDRIAMDDLIWTGYVAGQNTPPTISGVSHEPSEVITSSDDVVVSASIVDGDGIASAQLRWGTTSGSLSNTLAMTVEVDDTYTATIPAQADGTVVYYEIEATDANASPETTTSPEQSYTVEDPLPFGIPYANALRTNDDFADAEALGFLFDNASITNPGTNGYVRIINGSITTPAIDFSAYDGLTVSFGLGNYGGNTGQELSVLVSDDNGSTYTALGVFSHDSSTPATFEQVIDITSLNGTNGRIKFEMTAGSNSFRFRDLEIVESQGGNVGPVITNIEHNPLVVTSTDAVVVSAEITDLDGIASAELRWGTTTGTLTNVVPMSLDIDDTYTATIPAQADGTVVYYEIEATDANATPISTISDEYSYTVQDPVPFSIPYYNAFANQADYDEAVGYGFAFDNANQNGSYVRIINGSITTPAIDFSAYD